MSNFNLKKFLTENKLTNNSTLLQEEDITEPIPNDIIWTDEDEDTASQGTFNQFDQSAEDLEGYEVEVLGYSPSTGKAYVGSTYGSYGETEFDDVDGVRQMNSKETEYYMDALKKYEPEHFRKISQLNTKELNEAEASNKELLLELVDSFKSGLESTDDSEYNESISEAWCDDAVTEIMELKDYFVSKQSREDIFEEDVNEESGTFFKLTVNFEDKPGVGYGYTIHADTEEEARKQLADKLSQEDQGREYSISSVSGPSTTQAKPGALADIDHGSIEIEGIDMNDYPDFVDAYIAAANFEDGTPLTDEELNQLNDEMADEIHDLAYQSLFEGKTAREQKLLKEVFKTLK